MLPKDINKEYATCAECSLNGKRYVPTYVPETRQYNVLFIAEGPGETEEMTKVPLTGSAGKMHYSLLRMAGLNKLLLAHGNVVGCRPDNNDTPDLQQIACCFPRLAIDIMDLKPELIIALGDTAMQALTGVSGIQRNRGRVHPLLPKYQYSCQVYCLLHPSYVMRQRQWIPLAVDNLMQIPNLLAGFGIKEDKTEIEFLYDPPAPELAEYLNVPENTIIATDTESTGLNVRKDKIIGYSFSKSRYSAAAIAFIGDHDPRWPVVKEFLEDPKRLKCWQNGSYDTAIARENGIHDQGFVYDTRLASQMLYSDLPSDLDFLRAQYTNISPYKPAKREMKMIQHWSKDQLLEYANKDALTTYTVMEEQRKDLSEKQLNLMSELLIPLVRAIHRMESRGVLLDVQTLASLYSQIQPRHEQLEEHFATKGVNPRSSVQMKQYFQLKDTQEDTLSKQVERNHPMKEDMEMLLEYRGLQKLSSVYLKGAYKRMENGRIHTHYKIEGTGTGRLSSEDPNLQNIPDIMRVIYIADPEHLLISADYKQVELWVGAILAEEDQMLSDLMNGRDIHYDMCCEIWPKQTVFDKRQRNLAKTINFGTFYGRGAYSIARQFGITVSEAERMQMISINKYPKLLNYKAMCEIAFSRQGYLETPWGRRRYLSSITQGYNFPVQSTASDITLSGIVLLDQAKLWNWATVHDEVVIQVPIKSLKEDLATIKGILERPVPELNGIAFKLDYAIGPCWYDMKEVENAEDYYNQ